MNETFNVNDAIVYKDPQEALHLGTVCGVMGSVLRVQPQEENAKELWVPADRCALQAPSFITVTSGEVVLGETSEVSLGHLQLRVVHDGREAFLLSVQGDGTAHIQYTDQTHGTARVSELAPVVMPVSNNEAAQAPDDTNGASFVGMTARFSLEKDVASTHLIVYATFESRNRQRKQWYVTLAGLPTPISMKTLFRDYDLYDRNGVLYRAAGWSEPA